MDLNLNVLPNRPAMQFFLGLSLALRLWQDQPVSSLLAGSTRWQTVGRINHVAECGDRDEDNDEDEDEIPSYALLLTASFERFGVSGMRDFFFKNQ